MVGEALWEDQVQTQNSLPCIVDVEYGVNTLTKNNGNTKFDTMDFFSELWSQTTILSWTVEGPSNESIDTRDSKHHRILEQIEVTTMRQRRDQGMKGFNSPKANRIQSAFTGVVGVGLLVNPDDRNSWPLILIGILFIITAVILWSYASHQYKDLEHSK